MSDLLQGLIVSIDFKHTSQHGGGNLHDSSIDLEDLQCAMQDDSDIYKEQEAVVLRTDNDL
jgi:hypothetical protein